MTTLHPFAETLRALPALDPGSARPSRFERLRATLELMSERSRTRARLPQLDEHALRDIGLTSDEVEAEWRKFFWQA